MAFSLRQLLPLLILMRLTSPFILRDPRDHRARRRDETDINRDLLEVSRDSLFEGDVLLGECQLRSEVSPGDSPKLRAPRLWPNSTVIYDYEEGLAYRARAAIEGAIRLWTNATCLRFSRKGPSDVTYVLFVSDKGCWSYIGFQGGEQKLSVGRGCRHPGLVAHQIGHAIGFWHETSRPDRDDYVRIIDKNIESNYVQYFNRQTDPLFATKSNELSALEYDFESIMHFRSTSYSRGKRKVSIKVRQNWRKEAENLGQRDRLSRLDIKRANLLYSCPTGELVTRCPLACENGGTCVEGQNICLCPPSFTGMRCEEDRCKKLQCAHGCAMDRGKAHCTCRYGYGPRFDKKTCKDLDECVSGRCRDHQVCVNTPGSFRCICRNGYVEKNGVCEDEDECALKTNICYRFGPFSTCVNTNGSYECRCPSGFALLKNTYNCEDVDECALNTHTCSEMQSCVNTRGHYECHCPSGYVVGSNPQECDDVDECRFNNGDCDQKCINFRGSFDCVCDMGYHYDPSSGKCLDVDECANIGSKICDQFQACINHPGGYSCACKGGYGLHPVKGTCVSASVLRPSSCKEIKQMEIGRSVGEYQLYPVSNCDTWIRIYCADMDGAQPKSYLTLHSHRNTATSCSGFDSGVSTGCPRHVKRSWRQEVKAGSTTFQRIRVHLPKLYVDTTDTRFTNGTVHAVPYATAGSCWDSTVTDGHLSRTFQIDLRGTGLHVLKGMIWKDWSLRAENMNITFSSKFRVVDGVCGGRCNRCYPDGRLKLRMDSCRKARCLGKNCNNIQ